MAHEPTTDFDPLHASDSPGTTQGMLTRIKSWARDLKRDVVALWIAARSPRTPMAAKLVAGAVAAYALSPIDLIPDFIPVLGYLDDLLIVPLGIALAVRLMPAALMVEFRAEAVALAKPINRPMAMAIVVLWIVACLTAAAWCWSKLR
ncbi:YkvA family protein [Brevundimonas sp.]|uniref:YkvA family protein n=1 Tax=Brevundimonas sp. TaxID=1871086 RepID=UPI0028A96AFD|nr:YkvA family protein [Brevundimonas sp.]